MRKTYRVTLNNTVSDYNRDYVLANLSHRFTGFNPQFTDTKTGHVSFSVDTDEHLTNSVIRDKLMFSSFVASVSSGEDKKRVVRVPQLREAHEVAEFPDMNSEEEALAHLRTHHNIRLHGHEYPDDLIERMRGTYLYATEELEQELGHTLSGFDPTRPFKSLHDIIHEDSTIEGGLQNIGGAQAPVHNHQFRFDPNTFESYGVLPTDEQEYQDFKNREGHKDRNLPVPKNTDEMLRHLLIEHGSKYSHVPGPPDEDLEILKELFARRSLGESIDNWGDFLNEFHDYTHFQLSRTKYPSGENVEHRHASNGAEFPMLTSRIPDDYFNEMLRHAEIHHGMKVEFLTPMVISPDKTYYGAKIRGHTLSETNEDVLREQILSTLLNFHQHDHHRATGPARKDLKVPHRHSSTDFAHGKGFDGTNLTDTASNNPFTRQQGQSGVSSDLGIPETRDPQYIIDQQDITDPQRTRRLPQ